MSGIDVHVGSLELAEITRAITTGHEVRPPLVDMPQSIRLARAALTAGESLDSDVSLTWMRGGSLIAYAPLCLRRVADGTLVLQGMPHPLRLPALLQGLDEETIRRILDSFRDHLEGVLERTHAAQAHVWVPLPGELSRASIQARWVSAVTSVGAGVDLGVELAVSPAHSWSGVRKRYRSLINKGLREFSTATVTHGNTTSEIADGVGDLARLHAEAAGRIVYDHRLWDEVHDLLQSGSGACVLVRVDGRAVGGLLLLLDAPRSSYAIGAFDRELMAARLPVGHTALWSAISWLGEQGFTRLSLGAVPTPPPLEGKEAGIDQFKRGFATVLSPWVVTSIEATR